VKKKKDYRFVTVVLITEKPFDDRLDPLLDVLDKFVEMVSVQHQFELSEQLLTVIPDKAQKSWERCLYTKENWLEAKEKTRKWPYAFLMQDWNIVSKEKGWKIPYIDLQVDMCAMKGEYRHQNRHGYGISIDLAKEIYTDLVPLGFLTLIQEMAEVIGAIAGFVDFSAFTECHPLNSEMMGISSSALRNLRKTRSLQTALGYFWMTLLTGAEVTKLGGVESIRRDAPCVSIDVIERKDEAAVWLQMTENVFETTPEDRLRLREYLHPVLPEVDIYRLAYLFEYDKKTDLIVCTDEERAKIKELAMMGQDGLLKHVVQNRNG